MSGVVLIGAGPNSLGEKVADAFSGYPVYRLDKAKADGVTTVDATDEKFSDVLLQLLYKRQPELVVNFVGTIDCQPLADLELARFHSVIDINLTPLAQCARALANYEAETSFIQIGSNAGSYPFTNMFSYCVAKSAQKQAIKIMAKELAPRTRCNTINPGPMEPELSTMSTNQIPLIFGAEMPVDDAVVKMKQRIPLGRLCTIDDLVRAIRYLGYSAPFVTGQVLELSGGQIL